MIIDELPSHIVYSPSVIELVTVIAESCLFLENASELSRADFIDRAVKILPLLYLKAGLVQKPVSEFDDDPERFVTEEDYLYVKEQIEQLLGPDDSYLEVFHPDMALSDTPIAAFISESLADVYQEIKNFAANYQTMDIDIMNDSLVSLLDAFEFHWGQKALNALRALHVLRYSESFDMDAKEKPQSLADKIDRNSFVGFLKNEDESYDSLL
ncbi:MAG: DUF5063 domain-containing protein [Porphyromonadaceae bacterium CG2_30_38_12]|nr:MAG: DUF5063 domain-containing protein [Porphyromonadaceae bacterium CG2_30_38_12]